MKKKSKFMSMFTLKSRKRKNTYHKESDWYYQHSWFERKWFKHKLKRFIMKNFIYPLFEKSLETYFVEFGFFTPPSNKLKSYNKKHGTEYLGDFKMYIPLIVKVKNHLQAIYVANELHKTLIREYNIENIYLFKIGQKPLRKDEEIQIIERLNNEFENVHKTTLEINTYKPNNFGEYDFNKPKIDLTDIKVISVGSIDWYKQHQYTVLIMESSNEE